MATITESPVNFVEGQEYPSPVTNVLGFDYYDGLIAGVLKTADASVYRFDMTSEVSNSDGVNLRTFELIPLSTDVFDAIVKLLEQHLAPSWPVWVPIWTFPSEEIRGTVDREIDRLLSTGSQAVWHVTTHDLTESISATRAV